MTPWQRLGIEENANKKDIKRAYATLIKEFRPDDSPVEFQQIREAYEYMLADLADAPVDTTSQEPSLIIALAQPELQLSDPEPTIP